jgi:hypothetical protein
MKSLQYIYIAILLTALILSNSISEAQTMMQNNVQNNSFTKTSNPQLSASLSTSFTSFGSGVNLIGTSFMPQITFPMTEKFSISTGIGYSTFFIGDGTKNLFQSNQSQYGHVFVSGNYLLSDKISLRGTAYKTFRLDSPSPNIESGFTAYNFSSQGIIMDVEYKVSDNFRINVGFEYREQNYPMFGPGFNNNFNNSSHMGGLSPYPGFNSTNNFHPF